MTAITTREELDRELGMDELAQEEPGQQFDFAGRPVPLEGPPPSPSPDVWQIPGPRDGVTYSASEVAEISGTKLSTVRAWISRGLAVGSGWVRLRTLRVPRGRITPAALCEFLAAVNDVDVRIHHNDHDEHDVRQTALRGERQGGSQKAEV